jgi:S1-C subfamily serine protease
MIRALLAATLLLISSGVVAGQDRRVLHIKVVVVDAEGKPTPVPRHALLISDNPPSAAPRLITTGLGGTADVRLAPGNYTVESDKPLVFQGKAYQWTQFVDIVAGRDTALELTAENAEVAPATSANVSAAVPLETDPWVQLPQWQDSVVALWSPTTRASGFLIDGRGLVVTNQRVIGTATSVEVQLSPQVKVAASVLEADSARDVAVLWINPGVVSSVRAVPLGCADKTRTPIVRGQELFTIGAPLRAQKSVTVGTVRRTESRAISSDFSLATGSQGGPVFTASGGVVGITSIWDSSDGLEPGARIVRIDDACEVVSSAENKMKARMPPDGTHLPVEPSRPFPLAALKDAGQDRTTSLTPYRISAADFDVTFVTPVLFRSLQDQPDRTRGILRPGATPTAGLDPTLVRWLIDFGNWSEYVADFPPVLLVRVTPKLVENFWTTVARGAARTQGMALPPIKRPRSSFVRMRAHCGDAEVTPIHALKIEHRLSESNTIDEGLYVFDPGAFGKHCGAVTLVLYSDKESAKGDTRPVEPVVLQQIERDFAPYREP